MIGSAGSIPAVLSVLGRLAGFCLYSGRYRRTRADCIMSEERRGCKQNLIYYSHLGKKKKRCPPGA